MIYFIISLIYLCDLYKIYKHNDFLSVTVIPDKKANLYETLNFLFF